MNLLLSAVLSAYMAATGMAADLPERKTPDLSQKTVASESIESNATSKRRRAVRHPGPAVLDMQFMGPTGSTLTLTNYDAVPANVRACITTCTPQFTVDPNATVRYDVRSLGPGGLMVQSSTTKLDATTDMGRMLQTAQFTTLPQALPINDVNAHYHETFLHSNMTGTATIALRGFDGRIEDARTATVNAGTTKVDFPYGAGASGKHLEITSTVPIGATMRMVNGTNERFIPAKRLEHAVNDSYAPRVNSGEPAVVVNASASEAGVSAQFFQENTGNTFSATIRTLPANGNTWYANLVGSTNGFGNGAVRFQSNFPVLPFTMTPTVGVDEAAVGRTGLSGDTTTPYSLWFQNGNRIDAANASTYAQPISGTVTAYNGSTSAGSKAFQLAANGSTSIDLTDLPAERYRLDVNRGPQGDNLLPRVVATATDGRTTWTGYRTETPAARVTGEEYVAKWLDTLKTQYFYLSNGEVRCMINGNCGTRSYAPDMAAILINTPEVRAIGGVTTSALEGYLKEWADGVSSDGSELWTGFDPMNVNMKAPQGVKFYYYPDGGRFNTFSFDTAAANNWYTMTRTFLGQLGDADPTRYGGSASTGPNLDYNPTWSTQDKN